MIYSSNSTYLRGFFYLNRTFYRLSVGRLGWTLNLKNMGHIDNAIAASRFFAELFYIIINKFKIIKKPYLITHTIGFRTRWATF